MKTLNQILWENVLSHLDLGENGAYDEMNDLENDLTSSFKEWLEQHNTHLFALNNLVIR